MTKNGTCNAIGTIYTLKRAELAVRGCIELALSETKLTPSQHLLLLLVKTGEATSSAELARAIGMLPQSMQELISPLEAKGAIVRRPDPANNRILRIELTAVGERLFARASDLATRLERELLESFDGEQLSKLNSLLATLIAKAEAHSFHPNVRRFSKVTAKRQPGRALKRATRAR